MAELTDIQRQAASAAVARALNEGHGGTLEMAAPAAAAALGVGDLKEAFCKNWDTVKAVLQFLSGFLPAALRPLVAIIITAGDALHAAICGK